MPAIVSATLPADGFALPRVTTVLPDVRFECEEVVPTRTGTTMPLLRARGADPGRIEEVLANDPSTESVASLTESDDSCLLMVEWTTQVRLVLDILTQTGGTLTQAHFEDGEWSLQLLYPDREALRTVVSNCEQRDVPLDVERVREADGEMGDWHNLTQIQYETLVTASQKGYFAVPREVTLDELAEEMGISHQALSERMRRGIKRLVESSLPDHADSEDRQEKEAVAVGPGGGSAHSWEAGE